MPKGRSDLSLGDIAHLIGAILIGVAAAMAASALIGLMLRDASFIPLLASACITGLAGGLMRYFTHVPADINYREGFATVSLAWTAVGIFGALPYLISGAIPQPTEALFESISGFTTTGSTILSDIEALQPGILFWRSLTQWLGGMGIIVLGVAVLPYLGVGGMQLFRAEVPGPTPDRLRPRIRETAKLLWFVYAALTLAAIGLYMAGGMSAFDAVNHGLTTMPTGGFSPRNDSLAGYGSFVQWVAIAFMYLAGINFTLHYRAISRGALPYTRDTEWRVYTGFVLGATLIITLAIFGEGMGGGDTVRHALFQVLAIVTTTGYATADYELWPFFAQVLLFLLFFVGGMAGSTAGGPKVVRVTLILKQGFAEIRKQLHPRAVLLTKLGRTAVPEHVMLNVLAFMILYVGLFGAGTLLLSLTPGLSLASAAGAVGTAISNVGPGLDQVGPTDNFGFLPPGAEVLLMFMMLTGRLEIYTVLILFHPGLWRRR